MTFFRDIIFGTQFSSSQSHFHWSEIFFENCTYFFNSLKQKSKHCNNLFSINGDKSQTFYFSIKQLNNTRLPITSNVMVTSNNTCYYIEIVIADYW